MTDTNNNRRLTWNAAGNGGGGEDDKLKTNSKLNRTVKAKLRRAA